MTEGTLRIAIAVVAAVNLAIGLFAAIAPGSFYEEIGTYGAENGHYVGDVAAFYLDNIDYELELCGDYSTTLKTKFIRSLNHR